MPDLDDLHRLAPAVDTAAAAEVFRQRRRRSGARRRGAFAVAAALVVLVGAVAVLAQRNDEGATPVASGRPTDPGPVTFEVMSVAEAQEPMGTLRAATDTAALDELWAASGGVGVVPSVDLATDVVVSITIPDDACPPELTRFDRDGDTITPVFVEPTEMCTDPLIPKTFVVAIDRASVEPAFTLRLPADEAYGFGEQALRVELGDTPTSDPTQTPATTMTTLEPSEPSCQAIEAFATSLVETGITYDYEATDSPEELFERSEEVIVGTLTGQTELRETGPDVPGLERWIGYEVTIDSLLKQTSGNLIDGRFTVWTPHYGDREEAAARALDAAGALVVVFAYVHPALGLQASVEGIMTACPGGPLIGQHVSSQGDWPTIATLDELLARIGTAVS